MCLFFCSTSGFSDTEDPKSRKNQIKFHNLHEIDAVNIEHDIFSVLNNSLSVDELQQVEYLPT